MERTRADTAARVRGLYVIVDPEATRGRPVLEVADAVLEGGASLVQLRDKAGELGDCAPHSPRPQGPLRKPRRPLHRERRPCTSQFASGAHGLHLGQEDMPVAEARRICGFCHNHRSLEQHDRGGRGVPGRRRRLPRSRCSLPHVHNGQGPAPGSRDRPNHNGKTGRRSAHSCHRRHQPATTPPRSSAPAQTASAPSEP